MSQPCKTVRPRKDKFKDLDFAGWSESGWVGAFSKHFFSYLKGRDKGTAIGLTTLSVVGVACCTISSPAVLTTVVAITTAFGAFVLLQER
jgi:hypothetical protein